MEAKKIRVVCFFLFFFCFCLPMLSNFISDCWRISKRLQPSNLIWRSSSIKWRRIFRFDFCSSWISFAFGRMTLTSTLIFQQIVITISKSEIERNYILLLFFFYSEAYFEEEKKERHYSLFYKTFLNIM